MGGAVKQFIFTAAGIALGFALGGLPAKWTWLTVAGRSAIGAAALTLLSRILFKPPSVGSQKGDTSQTIQQPLYPPRWVLGRARLGGVMVWWRDGRTAYFDADSATSDKLRWEGAHMVLLLAAGECDGIEEIYMNDLKCTYTEAATTDGGRKLTVNGALNGESRDRLLLDILDDDRYPALTVYEYFKADGTQGKSIRDLYTSASDVKVRLGNATDKFVWNEKNKLRDISYVHVRMHQVSVDDDEAKTHLYRGVPNITFVMRGLKLKDPTQPNAPAVWTDNAALCRWWFLNARRLIEPVALDVPSFQAARDLCEQEITIPESTIDGFSQDIQDSFSTYNRTTKRYTINGIVNADDDAELVEDHMDLAWQGYVVESAGKFYFKPGAAESATHTITPDDIIAIGAHSIAPAFTSRVNQLQWGLTQSSSNNYQPIELPALVDENYLAADSNVPLARNIGSLAFVNDVIVALRLLSIMLRRARATRTWNYTLKAGKDFANVGILPSSRVLITDPEMGLNNTRLFVNSKTMNENYSVSLELAEDPDGLYSQIDIVEPPRLPRLQHSGAPPHLQIKAYPIGDDDRMLYLIYGYDLSLDDVDSVEYQMTTSWTYGRSNIIFGNIEAGSPSSSIRSSFTSNKPVAVVGDAYKTAQGVYTRKSSTRSRQGGSFPNGFYTETQPYISNGSLVSIQARYMNEGMPVSSWSSSISNERALDPPDSFTSAEFAGNFGYVADLTWDSKTGAGLLSRGHLTCAYNNDIKRLYPHLDICS